MRRQRVVHRFFEVILAGLCAACASSGAQAAGLPKSGVLKVDKKQEVLYFGAKTQSAVPNPTCTLAITGSNLTIPVIPLQCSVDSGQLSASLPTSKIHGIAPGSFRLDLEVYLDSGSPVHFVGTAKLTHDDVPPPVQNRPSPYPLTVSVKDKTLSLNASTDLSDGPYQGTAKTSFGKGNSASSVDVPVSSTVSHNALTAEIPLAQISSSLPPGPLTVDLEIHQGLQDARFFHGATTIEHADPPEVAQHSSEDASWYSLPFLVPYANLVALLGLIFALTGFAYILVEFPIEKSKRRELRDRLKEVSIRLNNLALAPASLQLPNSITPDAVGKATDPAVIAIQDQLKVSQTQADSFTAQLGDIQNSIRLLCAERDQLNSVGGVLYDSIQRDRASRCTAMAEVNAGVEFALAATVNRWIESGSHNRADLPRLATCAGIPNAELATLEDAEQVSKGVSKFRFTDDGAWLWTPVMGTADFWVAPADAQLMAMGKAPSKLDEMFEGMEKARHGFQFEAIYRSCRLRPSDSQGNYYSLVQRGALKLAGSPAPEGPKPQPFEVYEESACLEQFGRSSSAQLGNLFGVWVRKMEETLNRYGQAISLLQEDATSPRGPYSQANREELQQLWEAVQRLVDEQRTSTSTRFKLLEERLTAIATSRFAPTQPPAPPPARVSVFSHDAPPAVAHPSVIAHQPAPRAAPAATAPFSQPIQQVEAPFALEEKWHDAYLHARQQPDSKPEITEIPNPDLYVRRARNLRDSLRFADRSAYVSLMHIKKDSSSNMVEIHETDENAMGDIVCRICWEKHTWQLAVIFGLTGSNQIYLLFPCGALGKSNFAPGYSALIEDIPSSVFFMQPSKPALLGLQDAARFSYAVLKKMALESPEGGKS